MPNSLTHIILTTRGCAPRRPAAVIGTVADDPAWLFTGEGRPSHTAHAVLLAPWPTSLVHPSVAWRAAGRRRLPGTAPLPSPARSRCRCRSPAQEDYPVSLSLPLLRVRLGPAHLPPSPVPEDPFSSSVFGVLIRILATTTKICTGASSTRVHTRPSALPPRPPTPGRASDPR